MKKIIVTLISIIVLASCVKTEGEGGVATLKGVVKMVDIRKSNKDTLARYLPAEHRVYLVYGDNEIYDDDTRTDYNGAFQFKYLNPGSYTIYTYSECLGCDEEVEPVFADIKIKRKEKEVEADTIIVFNYR